MGRPRPLAKPYTGNLASSSRNCGESPVPSANAPAIRRLNRRVPPPFLRFASTKVFAQRCRQTRLPASRFGRLRGPFLVLAWARHAGIYPPVLSFRKLRDCLAPPGVVWQFPPRSRRAIFRCAFSCCRSSVVEHPLGKGEVECSIHSGSTTIHASPFVMSAVTPKADISGCD